MFMHIGTLLEDLSTSKPQDLMLPSLNNIKLIYHIKQSLEHYSTSKTVILEACFFQGIHN